MNSIHDLVWFGASVDHQSLALFWVQSRYNFVYTVVHSALYFENEKWLYKFILVPCDFGDASYFEDASLLERKVIFQFLINLFRRQKRLGSTYETAIFTDHTHVPTLVKKRSVSAHPGLHWSLRFNFTFGKSTGSAAFVFLSCMYSMLLDSLVCSWFTLQAANSLLLNFKMLF